MDDAPEVSTPMPRKCLRCGGRVRLVTIKGTKLATRRYECDKCGSCYGLAAAKPAGEGAK